MIRKGIHPTAVIDFQGTLELPESAILEPNCVFYGGPAARVRIGENNIFYPNCVLRIDQGFVETGEETSFGPSCMIYEPRGGLTIGSHCMIAGGVLISGVNHGSGRLDIPMRRQPAEALPITIGDDVWIGMGACILPGVTIGRGAIIGAGAVVTASIPELSVAIGVPCRVVRTRDENDRPGQVSLAT